VKFLIWAALGLLAAMMLRKFLAGSRKADRRSNTAEQQRMLPCAQCGTHFPASEALYSPAGAAYCSERHRSGAA
jgi:uncharacterized protein